MELKSVKVGDLVYIKCRDWPPLTTKVKEIKENIIIVTNKGNDNKEWEFSKLTGEAITPPFAYWISTNKR